MNLKSLIILDAMNETALCVGSLLEHLHGLLWSESFWLPAGYTWKDVESTPVKPRPQFSDVYLAIPLGLLILAVRILFQSQVFRPLGISLGLKPVKTSQATKNNILEKAVQTRLLDKNGIMGLAKQVEWSEGQVKRWLRNYQRSRKPGLLVKFCESGWRFTFYSSAFVYGLLTLWGKPWLWDTSQIWAGHPNQPVTWDIRWYYIFELGFYWSLMLSQFFDVRRKDFYPMFLHHCATILLMTFSWLSSCFRVGTLILLLHDISDIFMEAAKMYNYLGKRYEIVCNSTFGIFTITWFITRLGVFPYIVFKCCWIDSFVQLPAPFPGLYFLNTCLVLLQVLHVYWTYLILRVLCTVATSNQPRDVRSSSEPSSEEETSKASVPNGVKPSPSCPNNHHHHLNNNHHHHLNNHHNHNSPFS
ncbi:unnamed protein product [Darwinula stevensoni]|uniref:TLC domain-containing protein n=1 Tax=Darwinula stevensoni TaxID=69355 RepID=A0A7R8X2N4_9CRUS|nr:unnamed protein product [Darwinula stevensoni]CAG0883619.1 unnamed protein product [Darwinula stevensoni]